MNDPLLDELRAVFLDELADQLAILEEKVRVVVEEESAEAQRAAALEIRRAAHSLKGAARAVDFRVVEQICHRLESELAPLREPDAPVEPAAVAEPTEEAIRALRAWQAERVAGAGKLPVVPPSPPPVPPEEPAAEPNGSARPPRETVRIPVDTIDEVTALGEELLVAASSGERLSADFTEHDQLLDELGGALDRIARDGTPDAPLRDVRNRVRALAAWSMQQRRREHARWSEVGRQAGRLSVASRGLRATRFDALTPALERTVSETARDVGREAALVVTGGDATLDRRVVEQLREPLAHLLRNAVDHGLEPPDEREAAHKARAGTVEVRAAPAGTDLEVTVSDDGRGLDFEALRARAAAHKREVESDEDLLRLLFEPGFSTARVTTTTSGRGIGLDVVRHRVAELQGRVSVGPRPGGGTAFTLVVPTDLGVIRALVLEARGRRFVLAETAVERGVLVKPADERVLESRRYLPTPEGLVPLVDLGGALALAGAPPTGPRPALLLAAGDRRVAYLVDRLIGAREVVIKPLGPRVRRAAFVAGAALLDEGEVVCALDVSALVLRDRASAEEDRVSEAYGPAPRLMVVDDSVTTRQLLVSLLEGAGYQVSAHVDGDSAWRALMSEPLPDLLVTDIEMPRVDGFALLARIRGSPHTARLPVVLVTGLSSDQDRRRAVELGADAYVVKGRFDQRALLDRVEELLP